MLGLCSMLCVMMHVMLGLGSMMCLVLCNLLVLCKLLQMVLLHDAAKLLGASIIIMFRVMS